MSHHGFFAGIAQYSLDNGDTWQTIFNPKKINPTFNLDLSNISLAGTLCETIVYANEGDQQDIFGCKDLHSNNAFWSICVTPHSDPMGAYVNDHGLWNIEEEHNAILQLDAQTHALIGTHLNSVSSSILKNSIFDPSMVVLSDNKMITEGRDLNNQVAGFYFDGTTKTSTLLTTTASAHHACLSRSALDTPMVGSAWIYIVSSKQGCHVDLTTSKKKLYKF